MGQGREGEYERRHREEQPRADLFRTATLFPFPFLSPSPLSSPPPPRGRSNWVTETRRAHCTRTVAAWRQAVKMMLGSGTLEGDFWSPFHSHRGRLHLARGRGTMPQGGPRFFGTEPRFLGRKLSDTWWSRRVQPRGCRQLRQPGGRHWRCGGAANPPIRLEKPLRTVKSGLVSWFPYSAWPCGSTRDTTRPTPDHQKADQKNSGHSCRVTLIR